MKDIASYLRRRYSPISDLGTFRKAKRIISACPNLMVRPMLLYYIDDLIEIQKELPYAYQIYEQLISEWIGRESTKYSTRKKYKELMHFGVHLKIFSQKLAIDFYEKRAERNGYFLPANEEFKEGVLRMSELKSEKLFDGRDAKSKSLLNRNAAGDYKFAHKSILEYFLAQEMFQNPLFFKRFEFKGMDAAKRFLTEMVIHRMRALRGHYFIGEKKREFSQLNIEVVGQVERLSCEAISISPLYFSVFDNLDHLTYKNYHINSFIELKYAVYKMSENAKHVLTSIGELDIYDKFDFEPILYTDAMRNYTNDLIAKLNRIRQAVQPLAYLLKFFEEKDIVSLRKRLGFGKSFGRLPGPIVSMITAIDECVQLLQRNDHAGVKKGLPGIMTTIADLNNWLNQILTDEYISQILAAKISPYEKVYTIADMAKIWRSAIPEKETDYLALLERQLEDIIKLEPFFSQLELFSLKMPECAIRFDLFTTPVELTVPQKNVAV